MARGRKAAVIETGPVDGPWELPEGWEWAAMGSIADIIAGQSPPSSTYNQSGRGLPFFQGKAEFGKLHPVATKWCTEPTKVAEPDDILISVRAPVGPTNIADRRCGIGRGLAAIRSGPQSNTSWIRNWLLLSRGRLVAQATGTTFEAISGDVLRHHPIPVPPLDTQRRIVARIDELFSELDDGEAALARARADLETYRKSLLKAAVTGELTADWRAANPPAETGEQLLQRILADRKARWQADPKNKGKRYPEPVLPDLEGLPSIPESWAWVSPDVLSDAGKGQLVIGPFGSNLKVTDYCADGVPLVFVRHIRSSDFSGLKPQFVSASKAQELKSHWCKPGDVLITKMGDPPGDAALYPEGLPTAVITADCIRWRTSEAVRPDFAVTWINSHVGRTWIQRMTKGVAQQKISLEVFRGMPVAVPPLDEQDALLRELENMMPGASDLGSAVSGLALRSAASRQSILAAAFRGELAQ